MKTLSLIVLTVLLTSCADRCMVIEKQKGELNIGNKFPSYYTDDTIYTYKVRDVKTNVTSLYRSGLKLKIGEIVLN